MTAVLSKSEAWSLLSLAFACFGVLANAFQGDGEPLIASLAFSGLAYSATFALVRWLGPTFIKAGLKGKDMSKPIKKEMYCPTTSIAFSNNPTDLISSPETMGAVAASIYLLILIAFIPFPFYKDIVAATSGGGNRDVVLQVAEVETGRFLHRFPHSKVRPTRLSIIHTGH
jgi:UDP-N-acetylglucosamine--dolichyl-phosphate N-acetylglucosaminephosphotransferase